MDKGALTCIITAIVLSELCAWNKAQYSNLLQCVSVCEILNLTLAKSKMVAILFATRAESESRAPSKSQTVLRG